MCLILRAFAAILICGFARAEDTAAIPADGGAAVLTTGTKSWKMGDGTVKRMRFTGFSGNSDFIDFQTPVPTALRVTAFAEGEQDFLNRLRDGRLRLVSTPGLCLSPDLRAGTLKELETRSGNKLTFGESRVWTNRDGKAIRASLACLTDEDVSLVTGEEIRRVPLESLSAADLSYLDLLKKGEARVYAREVEVCNHGWESSPGYKVSISGERYAASAKTGGNIEKARSAAVKMVSGKLKEDEWEMLSFTEAVSHPPNKHLSQECIPVQQEPRCLYYTAEILLKKGGRREAAEHWPLTLTPQSWPVDAVYLHFMADGEYAPASPLKR